MADNNKVIRRFSHRLRVSSMIKEALDNLPCGVCFFDENGVPILVNKVMHQLSFALTRRDIQEVSDLDGIMENPENVFPGDGTVWRFDRKALEDHALTEINAADITELYQKRRELKTSNAEQQDIMRRLEELSRNVVSITRNEEILAMKMRVHSELGYALSSTRHFISKGCCPDEKADYIALQRKMARKLLGEVGNEDETDIFSELRDNARKLGMEIVCDGELPDFAEEIMTKAVRECLINTFRHAHGDKVYVKASHTAETYTAVITNNGTAPADRIIEGGGLSTLRKTIEENNGTMAVSQSPGFALTITLEKPFRDNL